MQRRVRTTIRPGDVLTVEDGDFASLQGQGLILEVLNDTNGEENSEVPPTPPVPPTEIPIQQNTKQK